MTSHPSLSALAKGLLAKVKAQVFLVTNRTNIRYLTGFDASAGILAISSSGMTLFLDGRYSEAAQSILRRGLCISPPEELKNFLKKFRSVAFEAEHVSVLRLTSWKQKFGRKKYVPVCGVVEALRIRKSPEELTHIRRACSITKALLRQVPRLLRTGITEQEIAHVLEQKAWKLGADGMAFETIVGFGKNTSLPHHHPTKRRLQRGDVVQVDLGVKWRGYCSDYSRVYIHGSWKPEYRKVYRALIEAKIAAERLVKPGADVRDLDRAARAVLKKYELESFFTHSLGHGLGLDIHEQPSLSIRSKPYRLQKNEVITVEPGVYLPGKFGMRIEDTILVI